MCESTCHAKPMRTQKPAWWPHHAGFPHQEGHDDGDAPRPGHHMVETFAPDQSDQSLGMSILRRRRWCNGLVPDTKAWTSKPFRPRNRLIITVVAH